MDMAYNARKVPEKPGHVNRQRISSVELPFPRIARSTHIREKSRAMFSGFVGTTHTGYYTRHEPPHLPRFPRGRRRHNRSTALRPIDPMKRLESDAADPMGQRQQMSAELPWMREIDVPVRAMAGRGGISHRVQALSRLQAST